MYVFQGGCSMCVMRFNHLPGFTKTHVKHIVKHIMCFRNTFMCFSCVSQFYSVIKALSYSMDISAMVGLLPVPIVYNWPHGQISENRALGLVMNLIVYCTLGVVLEDPAFLAWNNTQAIQVFPVPNAYTNYFVVCSCILCILSVNCD